jgi:hypothetical protein
MCLIKSLSAPSCAEEEEHLVTVIETASHVQSMQEMQHVTRDLLAHVERLTQMIIRLEEDKRQLSDEVDYLRNELAHHENDEPVAFEDRNEIEEVNRRLAGRYGVLEREMKRIVTPGSR